MLSQNLAFLRDLTTVNTAPRLSLLPPSSSSLSALSLTRISLYILRYSTKRSDLSDARLLFFVRLRANILGFCLHSPHAEYHEPRGVLLRRYRTRTDHRSSDAASKFRLPNAACLSLSLLRNFVHSSMIVFKYRTDRRPTDRPNTHSHSLVRIETELLS